MRRKCTILINCKYIMIQAYGMKVKGMIQDVSFGFYCRSVHIINGKVYRKNFK